MVLLRSIDMSKFGLCMRCTKHVLRRRVFKMHRLDYSCIYRNYRYVSVAVIQSDSSPMTASGCKTAIRPG